MGLGVPGPAQPAGPLIQRVDVSPAVPEVDLAAGDGRSVQHDGDAGLRIHRGEFEGPLRRAGGRVERVERAVRAAEEDAAADHRRLALHRRAGLRIGERPLQLEPAGGGRGDPALRRVVPGAEGVALPGRPVTAREPATARGRAGRDGDQRQQRAEDNQQTEPERASHAITSRA
jgi:hypothetical protein